MRHTSALRLLLHTGNWCREIDQATRFQLVPKSAGNGLTQRRKILLQLGGGSSTRYDARDGGVGKGELQCGRTKRNVEIHATPFEQSHSCQYFRGCRHVVV